MVVVFSNSNKVTEGTVYAKANMATKAYSTPSQARLPSPHGNQGWTRGIAPPPSARALEPFRQQRASRGPSRPSLAPVSGMPGAVYS